MNLRVEALLQPIPGAAPAGNSVSHLYGAIKQERQEDDPQLPLGPWQSERKLANWPRVVTLCSTALGQGKDLMIAAWLAEAWARLEGFAGAADGLTLMGGICERFWPEDAGLQDPEWTANILAWVDNRLSIALHLAPLAEAVPPRQGWLHWADRLNAERLERLRQQSAAEAARAEANGALSLAAFDAAFARCPLSALDRLGADVAAASAARTALLAGLTPDKLEDPPGLASLDQLFGHVAGFLAAMRPRMIPAAPAAPAPPPAPRPAPPAAMPLPEADRAAVYRQIADLAVALERIDPHSPAPYVLARVAQWEMLSLQEIAAGLHAAGGDVGLLLHALGLAAADE